MPAISEVLLNSQTHSGANANPVTVTGEKFKGDGYYGWGDGVHTVSFEVTTFVGIIKIQASLETLPDSGDWFDVKSPVEINVDGGDAFADVTSTVVSCGDGITPITVIKISNFTGNFVWVRAVATYTAGAINRVLFNH